MYHLLQAGNAVKSFVRGGQRLSERPPSPGSTGPADGVREGPAQGPLPPPDSGDQAAVATSAAGVAAGVGTSEADQLFDELFSAPLYKASQFEELLHRKPETRGTTEHEKKYWCHPRRWKVVLWDVKLQNCLAGDTMTAFVEFDVGGDREEFRVEIKGGEPPTDLNYRTSGEYWGSYLDIENEKLKIKVWTYNTYGINHLEALYEDRLESYAAGPVFREHDLHKSIAGKKVLRCRITFQLVFQEIYDFELSFFEWRIFGFQTGRELDWRLQQQTRRKSADQDLTETVAERLKDALDGEEKKRISTSTGTSIPENFQPQELTAKGTSKTRGSSVDSGPLLEKLTPEKEAALAECNPRLQFHIVSHTQYNRKLQFATPMLENNVRPFWKSLGTLYFRGTTYDLEAATLHVRVIDSKSGRPSSKQCVARGQIPLRGVVDYAYLRTELSPPSWVAQLAKKEAYESLVRNWAFGSVEGKIGIANTPRHRQQGDIGVIDTSRVNLFVAVEKVDTIVTLEGRKDVSPFVEVSFDGDSRCTRVIERCTCPEFNELLVLPLQLPDKLEILRQDIETKPLIWVDVWSQASVHNEHCGGTAFSLRDIFFDSKNNRRDPINVKVIDRLDPYRPSSLPVQLLERLPSYEAAFSAVCDQEALKLDPGTRYYSCYAIDQRRSRNLLPTFCGKVVPPKTVDNCFAIAHYVRCIPYVAPKMATGLEKAVDAWKQPNMEDVVRMWATPEFTLTSRSGAVVDHVLLHASLLIGLSVQAFVCIGTLWPNVPHAWVCTFHYNAKKEFGFWEATTGHVFVLKRRFKDRQVIKKEGDKDGNPLKACPRLPYRSLDFMFNHLNIWVNKQDPSPAKIWFDIWRAAFWHQLTPEHYDIQPSFLPRAFGAVPSAARVAYLKAEIFERCQTEIWQFRTSRHLSTRWNRDVDLLEFLERGLELLHQSETSQEADQELAEAQLKEWKAALYAKLPRSWRLRGLPVHFNRPDAKMISSSFVQQCDFLDCRERLESVSSPATLPHSVYVEVILVQKVTEREKRRFREQEEKARRDKALKRLARKRRRRHEASVSIHKLPTRPVDETSLSPLIRPESSHYPPSQDYDLPPEPATSVVSAEGPSRDRGGASARLESRGSILLPTSRSFMQHRETSPSQKKHPKKKLRKLELPPGTIRARLVTNNVPFSGVYSDPSRFRDLMETVEDCLSDGLRVPRKRVKAYECWYRDGIITFAILPPTSRSPELADQLLSELAASITDMIRENSKLSDITNGAATVIDDITGVTSFKVAVQGQLDNASQLLGKTTKHKRGKKHVATSSRTRVKAKAPLSTLRSLPSQQQYQSPQSSRNVTPHQHENPSKENDDDKRARDAFYAEMQEADSETFTKLLEYYLSEGHPEEHARYFAAYYTALKVQHPEKIEGFPN